MSVATRAESIARFVEAARAVLPATQVAVDELTRFACSTDASFYRLVPQAVLRVANEDQIRALLPLASQHGAPITFRAAGTSLSGQAVTDGVLLKLSHMGRDAFRELAVLDGGRRVRVGPGVIGGEVNRKLSEHARRTRAPLTYKIGPDPASIDSAMMGGILANNSSGMCCGVVDNAYNTVEALRVVLADGTVLDTGDANSRAAFEQTHAALLAELSGLAQAVQDSPALAARIRRKYSIKCTTGYSLNALIDCPPSQPFAILQRLLIGSEGTLGFISQATLRTVVEHRHKASAFIVFASMHDACVATASVRAARTAAAVELFDAVSLRAMRTGYPSLGRHAPQLLAAPPHAAALLVECRANDEAAVADQAARTLAAVRASGAATLGATPHFTSDAREYGVFWDARKGLIPIVGGAREPGTSLVIEDVACAVERLAPMAADLADAFKRLGYGDTCLFGHAQDGNLHAVFAQGFRTRAETDRFARMMDSLAEIVVGKYDGSLKAEHGTGRNMAPFVATEWGDEAVALMWRLKRAFDPAGVLNPGVILSDNPRVHLEHLKATPVVSPIVDACIECGFCESVCPSRDVALTPRQRIATHREISRLRRDGSAPARLAALETGFALQGDALCAADGMCASKCPVGIDTGALIKSLRAARLPDSSWQYRLADHVVTHFARLTSVAPPLLSALAWADARLPGAGAALAAASRTANALSDRVVPLYSAALPRGAPPLPQLPPPGPATSVVYFASCATRVLGAPRDAAPDEPSTPARVVSLLRKAGRTAAHACDANGGGGLCCGMAFASRGLPDQAARMLREAQAALDQASRGGEALVLVDNEPCLQHLLQGLPAGTLRKALRSVSQFVAGERAAGRLVLQPAAAEPWAGGARAGAVLHVPCSAKRLGHAAAMHALVAACLGAEAVRDSGVACCGMAGDRGLRLDELPRAALAYVEGADEAGVCLSASRTCEIALERELRLPVRSVAALYDECARPGPQAGAGATLASPSA